MRMWVGEVRRRHHPIENPCEGDLPVTRLFLTNEELKRLNALAVWLSPLRLFKLRSIVRFVVLVVCEFLETQQLVCVYQNEQANR